MAIQKDPAVLDDAAELRRVLLDFIADFANWDNSTDAAFLEVYRILEASCGAEHERTVKMIQSLVDLYSARHEVEPDQGHDPEAAAKREKLEARRATTHPARHGPRRRPPRSPCPSRPPGP